MLDELLPTTFWLHFTREEKSKTGCASLFMSADESENSYSRYKHSTEQMNSS